MKWLNKILLVSQTHVFLCQIGWHLYKGEIFQCLLLDVVISFGVQLHWGVHFILLHWDAGVRLVLIGTLAGLASL